MVSLTRNGIVLTLLSSILAMTSCAPELQSSSYAMISKVPLFKVAHWDYMTFDPESDRLYITHEQSVDVLDVLKHHVVGSISNMSGVHGVALAPNLGKGFISDGVSNNVVVFDLVTLKSLDIIPAGSKPDAIVYDPHTTRVFAANGKSNDLTVINAKDDKVVKTIKLSGKPEFSVINNSGLLFVNIEDKSQISVIDTENLKVIKTYDLSPNCTDPTGLAIDTAQNRLFSVCSNKVMVILQGETGKILDTLPTGEHSDAAVYDAGAKLAFSSNGEGTLTIVAPASDETYKVIQTINTLPTARTMALNPATHEIYLSGIETEAPNHASSNPLSASHTLMLIIVGPKTEEISR